MADDATATQGTADDATKTGDDQTTQTQSQTATNTGQKGDDQAAQKPQGDDKGAASKDGKEGATPPGSMSDEARTALSDDGDDDKGKAKAPADWPDDWRDKMAGDDKKLRKRLDRFSDPSKILQFALSAEQKVSKAEKQEFPEKGTDEEKAAWREANGVPADAKGYLEELPDGLVIGDDDKERVESFTAFAHEINAPKQFVQQAIAWRYRDLEEQAAAQKEKDAEYQEETEDALRPKYGDDYRRNMTDLKAWLQTMPEEQATAIQSARLPDRRPLFSDPVIVEWWVDQMRQVNPLIRTVSGKGDPAVQIADELSQLEAMMGDKTSEYWKGPKAEANQARYRELIEAKQRLDAQAA